MNFPLSFALIYREAEVLPSPVSGIQQTTGDHAWVNTWVFKEFTKAETQRYSCDGHTSENKTNAKLNTQPSRARKPLTYHFDGARTHVER